MSTNRSPSSRCTPVGVLERLARLGVPEPHQVADRQQRRRRAGERRLDLAGPLEPGQVQPGRRPRGGQPVGAGRAGGDEAAAVHGRDLRRRAGGPPAGRRTPRAAARRTGSGRRAWAPAGRSPAATSVTTGSATVSSTEPEPPAFQNSRSATSREGLGDLPAAYLELGQRQRLEPAYDAPTAPAGSVRRPGPRRPGPRRSSRRPAGSRAAPGRTVASATTPRGVVAAASAWARRAGRPSAARRRRRWRPAPARPCEARTESTTSRWAGSSTISGDPRGGPGRRDQPRQRGPVDRRVGDDEVVADALLLQPQRLGAACRPGRRGTRRGPARGGSAPAPAPTSRPPGSGCRRRGARRSPALASKASRSTTIDRGGRRLLQRRPRRHAAATTGGCGRRSRGHQVMPRLRRIASMSAMSSSRWPSLPPAPRLCCASHLLRRVGATDPSRRARRSSARQRRRTGRPTARPARRPSHTTRAEDQARRPSR